MNDTPTSHNVLVMVHIDRTRCSVSFALPGVPKAAAGSRQAQGKVSVL